MIFESDFHQVGWFTRGLFSGILKSFNGGVVYAGTLSFSWDSESYPARGNQDIFINTRSNQSRLSQNPPYGYSGNEELVDFRILPNRRIVILARSDSPELVVKLSNSRELVNWLFMVDLQTGKMLTEYVLPYNESGLLGDSNGVGDLTVNYASGLQLNLFVQHILRVTTFSPTGSPYSVSRSDDLYDWFRLEDNLHSTIQWDFPMNGDKGFLKIDN